MERLKTLGMWLAAGICGAALFGLFYALLWLGYILGFVM